MEVYDPEVQIVEFGTKDVDIGISVCRMVSGSGSWDLGFRAES